MYTHADRDAFHDLVNHCRAGGSVNEFHAAMHIRMCAHIDAMKAVAMLNESMHLEAVTNGLVSK